MKQEYYHIAQLLSKHFQNKLSDDEQMFLDAWLRENDPDKRLLDSFKGNKADQDIEFWMSLDVENAWSSFQKKKRTLYWKGNLHYTKRIASILIIGSLFSLAIWWGIERKFHYNINAEMFVSKVVDVDPASQKAHLKLSDGTLVDLEKDVKNIEELDGTEIITGDVGVSYRSQEKLVNSKDLIYNTLVVPKAGTYHIELSDGTKVWMNALSELSFPVIFGEKERLVHLKGEAYFEVSHDPERPFIVESNGNRIRVLGTNFNVNAYDQQFVTTLVGGSVEVRSRKGEKQMLRPGYSAKVEGTISIEKAYVPKIVAWKDGFFYFKSDRLEEVIDEISRWYNIEIEYEHRIQEAIYLTGKISRDSKLSEVLEMVEYASGAETRILSDKVLINFE